MYVGGCEVWGSGFGRWARPILTDIILLYYILSYIILYMCVCFYLFETYV